MTSRLATCLFALGALGFLAAPAVAGGSLKDGGRYYVPQGHVAPPACCGGAPSVVYWQRPVVHYAPVVTYVPTPQYVYPAVPYDRCCQGYAYGYAYTGYGCR